MKYLFISLLFLTGCYSRVSITDCEKFCKDKGGIKELTIYTLTCKNNVWIDTGYL